jgi:hypothetical protein
MPKLTEDEKEQLRAGLSMRDEDIDYSDIPPIREIPPDAIRGRNSRFYRGRIVYLTEELHAYFCDIAMRKGVSLNDVVNDLLSKEVAIVEAMN